MIAYLKGRVLRMPVDGPVMVLLTDSGIGYEITLPAFVHHSLQQEGIQEGDEVGLDIYYHVTDRQPKPVLVGFRDASQKRFFEQMIAVEGVGPVKAANALVFAVGDIARAIEDEDVSLLRRMPGIGDRAAQKMIATLRGKVTEWAMTVDGAPAAAVNEPTPEEEAADKTKQEAIDVLISLGHRQNEAKEAVEKAIAANPDLADNSEDLIREIFRTLAGVS